MGTMSIGYDESNARALPEQFLIPNDEAESVLKSLVVPEGRYDYHVNLHPFVWEKYLAFCETGKFPYNSSVENFIKGFLPVLTEDQFHCLKTQVYNASCRKTEEDKQAERNRLLSDGWKPFVGDETVKAALEGRKRILIHKKGYNILLQSVVAELTYRPYLASDGRYFLMKPRAKNRGFLASQFANAFYKFV